MIGDLNQEKEKRYLKLIADNRNIIYKVASLYTNDKESREDLMQEIAYQIWRSFDSFAHRSSVSTWLYRIALNTAIQSLKKEKRQIPIEDIKGGLNAIVNDSLESPDEDIQRMMRAIQNLKQIDKGIILLYLEERSHQEIADIIGISVSNVGTRIQRIKKKLKTDLEK